MTLPAAAPEPAAAPPRRSLAGLHPGQAVAILLLLLADGVLLGTGLFLPAIAVTQLGLFETEISIRTSLEALRDEGSYVLLAVILLFSVVLPYLKLLLLGWLMLWRGSGARRHRLLRAIGGLGKWSMLDVLALALVVVTMREGFWVSTTLRPGIYVFAGAVVLAMLLTGWVTRLAARNDDGDGRLASRSRSGGMA